MHSSYCHLTEDKIVKEHEKGHSWIKLTKDIALLLTLKVNSEQQLPHMEPDSSLC